MGGIAVNRIRATRRYLVAAVGLLVALAVAVPQVAAGGNDGALTQKQLMPVGYDGYLVMVGNGSWNLTQPHPVVPGCFAMFCDGMYYQREIMRRTADQIAQKEQEAVEHFRTQFGIDVNDPANAGRVQFRSWMADPRWNYRVYSWGGRAVPASGYEVRDGGWGVWITDPAGYTLGGEMAGVHVKSQGFAFTGDYNVLLTNPAGKPKEEFVLSYRGDTFMDGNQVGDTAFSCALSSNSFATDEITGFAQGFMHVAVSPQGVADANLRNVITFGKAGDRR